jgi:phosphohistidine swiveling domain-containing protein
MTEMVRTFDELETEKLPLAGGKGAALARLRQAGYPVPDGFVILPDGFDDDHLKPQAWSAVQAHLEQMRKVENGMAAFAVRSSALSEDSARASFAGEFETVLDLHTDEAIQAAIHTVRHSRHSERVQVYSEARGIDSTHELAVVVQRLVRADISGVLFTANPVTGSRAEMTGNFVYGFGEELVSGEAEPYTFTLERPNGRYHGPPELKRIARKLYKLASRLEQELGNAQDIEWCVVGDKLHLLQSRPITTLIEHDPTTGEWNATLRGDYLWTNMIVGEVFPESTTPSTWSVWQGLLEHLSLGDIPTIRNIAGRLYLNYSLLYSFLLKFLRSHERIVEFTRDSVGIPPEGMEIPRFPISMKTVLFRVIPHEVRNAQKKATLKKSASEYLSAVQDKCQAWQLQIREIREATALIPLWRDEIEPTFSQVYLLQDALNEDLQAQGRKVKNELTKLVGVDDANTLLASVSGNSGELASLGPIVGLSKLQSGEMDRQEYLRRYGHRTPNENELAEPRPYEDPGWLDRQLERFAQSPATVASLQEQRRSKFNTIWEKIEREIPPKKARAMRDKIDQVVQTNTIREATRSELTRTIGVIRALYLRAGEFTGLGDDIFFLEIDEVDDVLSGDASPTAFIAARRETHEKYRALPPLPIWIRGRFDPVQWAADPGRRTDVFDASAPLSRTSEAEGVITGHPGSSGRVEGIVRRIDSPDEGAQLQPGEILVTSTTNVGWTLVFPRAAAVVTDIGASLSHAAIVAREIGIPAVVGCGNATMRLKTGDRVRVDGGQGTVEILDAA